MAIDRARDERERVAESLPLDDARGLLSDRQPAGHALLLDSKLEHERQSRDSGALPSPIPRVLGALPAGWRQREAWDASPERSVDGRCSRVTCRVEDRDRRDCQNAFHLDTS